MKPSPALYKFLSLFLAASFAAPAFAEVLSSGKLSDTEGPGAESVRFYLEQVERRQRAIADQHEQLKVKAQAQAQYIEENHDSIRQNAVETQAALIAHYEMLYQQALQQARELEENDQTLFQQALEAQRRHAQQHAQLHDLANQRAAKAHELLQEFEKLPSDKQMKFLKDREPQLRALERPPQLSVKKNPAKTPE